MSPWGDILMDQQQGPDARLDNGLARRDNARHMLTTVLELKLANLLLT